MTQMEWPWQYSFPPFFTIQPNVETRKKQLEAWRFLVLEFYRVNKLYILDVREAERLPLFNNSSINRKLSSEGIITVLNTLEKTKNAEPVDKSRTRWFVYWHTLVEWADIIYNWAKDSGQINSVCTLFEIKNTTDTEFSGLNQDVLVKVLKVLETQKKAELIMFGENEGVKFF
uniref:Vacuolar protein-sorting-associated protein 25 n=1 Tax=Clastoptera arizonana TaxID=38151 RepID=A0A1B6C7Q5_9HEMI